MISGLATPVGVLSYDVAVDTSKQLRAEREATASMNRMAAAAEQVQNKFSVITRAVQVYAAALALLKMAQVADDFKLLQARVNVASKSIGEGADNMDRLRKISTETRSALADNVQVFTRLNPSITQMGGNAKDTLRIVDLLSKAITVSGATAAEKSSAMIQFGQALGSGRLAGDELRSLLENAPYLMKQLADGLGVPIGALKGLGEQGKLTADVVVNALGKATAQINKDFAQFPQTVSSAMTVAGDALTRLIAKLDEFSGKNVVITGVIGGVTKALSTLADMFGTAAKSADDLARKTEIEDWSRTTAMVLSYVADAADVTWQTLSVLGRNVAFVFNGVKSEILGIGAQIKAVVSGDFSGAAAIGAAIKAEAEAARKTLDEADARTLADRKLWGQQMRDVMEEATAGPGRGGGRGGAASKLTPPPDPEAARKQAAQRAATRAYYEGLLADTQTGLAKIAAEQKKAEAENDRRQAEAKGDKGTMKTLLDARPLIVQKFERERAALEETYAKDRAAANIAVTTDEQDRILAIRNEAFRAADAEVRLGVKTVEQGENAKRVAAFQTGQMMLDLADRNARARAEQQLAETRDAMERIRLTEAETISALMLAKARDKITQAEYEAGVAKAKRQTEDSTDSLKGSTLDFKSGTAQMRAGSGNAQDAIAAIKADETAKLAANDVARKNNIDNLQMYADREVAIKKDAARRVRDTELAAQTMSLQMASGAAANLFSILEQAGQKRSGLAKALFVAEKALAIALIIQNTEVAASKAGAELGIFGIPMATMIRAQGYSSAALVAAQSIDTVVGGREYGGPVSAGSMYRVNETGRPEMYTAANGAQYMLPNASGSVTPADQVGGSSSSNSQRPIVVTMHFTVQQGTSAQTQQQMATAAARGLQQPLLAMANPTMELTVAERPSANVTRRMRATAAPRTGPFAMSPTTASSAPSRSAGLRRCHPNTGQLKDAP